MLSLSNYSQGVIRFAYLVLLAATHAGLASGGGFFFGRVTGVEGVDAFDNVRVILSRPGLLDTVTPDSDGQFAFYDLADGDYVVKVRKPGFKSAPAHPFRIERGALVSVSGATPNFVLQELGSDAFVFHWEEDQSTAGYEYQANVAKPLEVEFLGEEVAVFDSSAGNQLQYDYNISLLNGDGGSWTSEHAYRLLRTLEAIPQWKQYPGREETVLRASQWFIAPTHVEDDIRITGNGEGPRTVWIAEDAFVDASPKLARVDGKRGVYYSQRLHHALVRYVTDNGRNEWAYEKILKERFGLTTRIGDYEELTANTTGEPASRFQRFHPEEIVQLINLLEEMPAGMHVTPGLGFLVRRLNGTQNPGKPQAPAIAWTAAGYIEFMDAAFDTASTLTTHRLIIHEKAHFLWAQLFDAQLKQAWIELGGWYRDASTASGWATTKQTEFVSAYAHQENPNEDMAESIAYFIVNPRKLRSRAIGKYEFIRDRIMQGNVYISKIREDLTFEVYNLFPDYVFPGKIRRVDIVVEGAGEEDKRVDIEIELHAVDHVLEGARSAQIALRSEAGTYRFVTLWPHGVPWGTPGTVLAGSLEINRFAKAGYWRPFWVWIEDEHGNRRLAGANDFGWTLFVNNPLEDSTPPQYVSNSASLTKSTATLEGKEVQIIHATWGVDENSGFMDDRLGCLAALNDELPSTYSFRGSSRGYDSERRVCWVDFVMPPYMPSSVYTLDFIVMRDRALNYLRVYFEHAREYERLVGTGPIAPRIVDEPAPRIELTTDTPDTTPPELELNNIQISAQPTNPEAPNGETLVTLTYRTRDDISGFQQGEIYLRDPQGIDHRFWFDATVRAGRRTSSRWFPDSDPMQWAANTWSVLLPPGSAAGKWGLAEMILRDRAGNQKKYDFTEIVHFEVQ